MKRPWPVVVALGLVLAACPKSGAGVKPTAIGDPFSGDTTDESPVLRRELEAEVLEGYERDDTSTSEDWQGAIDPEVGIVRFGVRAGDRAVVTSGPPPSRALPLGLRPGADDADNPACAENLRSKALAIHLTPDGQAAWVTDELSACVSVCGKQALIPLRLSAVYVRGGDRWVLAVEHVSYPQQTAALIARGENGGKPIDPAISERAIAPDFQRLVARAVSAIEKADREGAFSTEPDAIAWWPDLAHELRAGAITTGPSLTDAFDAASITTEPSRIGIGPSSGTGSIAWWSGTLLVRARTIDQETPIRLRATFVLRRDAERWRIVESHVSAPISDDLLAKEIAADATIGPDGRIRVPCERAPTTPAAARR
ncbi:MAG TPA: nuclear transport factor 2 family protein [Kofleriaceae bacterium]|nr:nuclear transport factor 2 family protein [Kofleriaceae bacterium]